MGVPLGAARLTGLPVLLVGEAFLGVGRPTVRPTALPSPLPQPRPTGRPVLRAPPPPIPTLRLGLIIFILVVFLLVSHPVLSG